MSASLGGFGKVPPYAECFPEKPKPASTSDLAAFFGGFSGVKIRKQ
jgi:hypothetical protein